MARHFTPFRFSDPRLVSLNKLWAVLCLSLIFFLPSCVTIPAETWHLRSDEPSAEVKADIHEGNAEGMSFKEHLRLGRIYESNGNLRPALREYKRARLMRKKDSRPYFGMGNIQLRSGYFDQAEWSYKKAIKYNPSVGVYHNNLAWVYIKTHRYSDAYSAATRGATLDIRRPYIYLDTIGVVEMRLGNLARAEQKFKDAVASMPPANRAGLLSVYENLRELYTMMNSRVDDIIEVERRITELKRSMGSTVPMLP